MQPLKSPAPGPNPIWAPLRPILDNYKDGLRVGVEVGGLSPPQQTWCTATAWQFSGGSCSHAGPWVQPCSPPVCIPRQAPPFRGPSMMALIEASFSTPSQCFSTLALPPAFLLTRGSRQKPFPQGSTVTPGLSPKPADHLTLRSAVPWGEWNVGQPAPHSASCLQCRSKEIKA